MTWTNGDGGCEGSVTPLSYEYGFGCGLVSDERAGRRAETDLEEHGEISGREVGVVH
jgi:hypothetical protein